jgi:hypothetical protein
MRDNKLKKFLKLLGEFEAKFQHHIPGSTITVILGPQGNGKINYAAPLDWANPHGKRYMYFGSVAHLMEILTSPLMTIFLGDDVVTPAPPPTFVRRNGIPLIGEDPTTEPSTPPL